MIERQTRLILALGGYSPCWGRGLPKPLGLVVDGASEATRLSVVHLLHHLGVPGLVGVGGKLDCDWLRAARRGVAVQVLDGVLGLGALVVADESHTARQTCRGQRGVGVGSGLCLVNGVGRGRDSPEAWSTSTLELMMCPKRPNMSSRSCWLTVLGSPLIYRLASLIMSELGRANDTWWRGGDRIVSLSQCIKSERHKK